MAKSECTTKLILTEQEVIVLKAVLTSFEYLDSRSTLKMQLASYQVALIKDINKALPNWFRAYNTDEELNI